MTASAFAEERPSTREEASRKELLHWQGTWRFHSLEGAKKGPGPDLENRTFFVGGNLFLVREGDKIVQAGTLRVAPGKTPRAVDAEVAKGPFTGNRMLGIYELKGDTLKVCFDPEGDARPKTFAARSDSDQFVAVYKRVRGAGEEVEIVGRYKSESFDGSGAVKRATAEIQRKGDAYIVLWSHGGVGAFIGVGIRKANVLSVAWTNREGLGVSVYQIEKGPKLVGTYTDIKGVGVLARENLTAEKEVPREARLPRAIR
jgi:uncharacterized protein (TIGR03067 family)